MKLDEQTIFKSLHAGALSPYQSYQWPVPNGKAGAWVEAKGKLGSCQNGLHLARGPQLFEWLEAEVYLAEFDGEMIDAGNKLVCRKARLVEQLHWNPRIACAFAVDCADRVLHFFEEWAPGDDRPRKALQAAADWVEHPRAASVARAARADWAARAATARAASAARAAWADRADSAAWAARADRAAWADRAASAAWADRAVSAAWAARAARAASEKKERAWQYQRLCKWLTGELTLP
jgi:hypothetical protein